MLAKCSNTTNLKQGGHKGELVVSLKSISLLHDQITTTMQIKPPASCGNLFFFLKITAASFHRTSSLCRHYIVTLSLTPLPLHHKPRAHHTPSALSFEGLSRGVCLTRRVTARGASLSDGGPFTSYPAVPRAT